MAENGTADSVAPTLLVKKEPALQKKLFGQLSQSRLSFPNPFLIFALSSAVARTGTQQAMQYIVFEPSPNMSAFTQIRQGEHQ
jgi:hypothetical protein